MMRATCPACDRKLLSSISPTCGWCGAAFPEHLKPTQESIRALQAEEDAAARRERELERIAKEAKHDGDTVAWWQF